MSDDIDAEKAVRILENEGSTATEQKEALSVLRDVSHTQPDALVPHLDDICSFADDDDPMVATSVATILSHVAIHEPSVVVPHASAVQTLLTNDDDPGLLSVATKTAVVIASESPAVLFDSTDQLLDLLQYEDLPVSNSARNIRLSAASALGMIGEANHTIAAQAEEPLVERLDDGDAGVRKAAAMALSRLGSVNPTIAARADESLAECLDDPEPKVRGAAVTAFTRFGLEHPDAAPTGLDHLSARLADDDADVRRKAIRAYTLFRHEQPAAIIDPDTVVPALREATEQTELDSTEASGIVESCQYIEEMAADQS